MAARSALSTSAEVRRQNNTNRGEKMGSGVNEALPWFDVIRQELAASSHRIEKPEKMVTLLEDLLLNFDLPAALQSAEKLKELKKDIGLQNPFSPARTTGLVDDLAARIQGKSGADLALAIRIGDCEAAMDLFGFPEGAEAYQRIWRAILENPRVEIFESLRDRLLPIQVEALASVINRSQIPLIHLLVLLGPQAKEILFELAPHLSYAHVRGLDETLQKDLLETFNPSKLKHLSVSSSEITGLPKGMEALQSLDCSWSKKLELLPEDMKALQKLDCSGCSELKHLPNEISALRYLDCNWCSKLENLPSSMPELQILCCRRCEQLKKLPDDMTALRTLKCGECTNLEKLPGDMTRLESLDCSLCENLAQVPEGMDNLTELVCSSCPSLAALPNNMKDLEILDCSSCHKLVHLPNDLSALLSLNCSHCKNLLSLPSGMKALTSLNCRLCNRFTCLPNDVVALEKLNCSECRNLESLPSVMPGLKSLDCNRCDKLASLLNGMRELESLNCSLCLSLANLPEEMVALKSLDCSYCRSLENLPDDMANLRSLNCSSCESLAALPGRMTGLKNLCCKRSAKLEGLPEEMTALQNLDCSGCTLLASLPSDMSALQTLECSGCNSLESLPEEMIVLESLNCRRCTNLANLPPALPCCTVLDFSQCPLLENTPIPEIPANAAVFRSVAENGAFQQSIWRVPYEKVELDPKDFLCQLGEKWLLANLPFPGVAYLEKDGLPFNGVDFGGVRRDLVSRILSQLFSPNLEKGKVLVRTEDLFPICQIEDENQLSAYRSLARLMALSYQHVCRLTTGPLFSERLYQALLTEPNSLDRAAGLMGLKEELVALAAGKMAPDSNLSPEVTEQILYYLDPKGKRFSAEKPEMNLKAALADLEAKPEALQAAILNEMNYSEGKWIQINQAVDPMRAELQLALGPKIWNQIQEKEAAHLQKEIEGELSAEALRKHLDWDTGTSTEAEVRKTKKFLKCWIREAPIRDLEDFVRAVSGNRSLTPKRLRMELYRRGPERLPVAHSCGYSLELSSQLPNQETFDTKMRQFLENALAESGFQIA